MPATAATITVTVDPTVGGGASTVTTWPTASAITLGEALSASTLTGGAASVPGTFAFTTPGLIPPAAGSYTAWVTFTPSDTARYEPVTGTVNVMVNAAAPTDIVTHRSGYPAL